VAWDKQKSVERAQVTNQLRQARVREFLQNLRENAKVDDHRKQVEAAFRRQAQ
jgi:hypothetical protein